MSARFRRWRRPGVEPLSIWNLDMEGTPLWQLLGQPRVLALRAAGVAEAEIGGALAVSALLALKRLRERHRCERAFVGGGLTLLEGFAARLREAGDGAVEVCGDGPFVGERGGLALLGGKGRGLVVDVGQTAIKLSARGRRLLRTRDPSLLPLELIDPGGAPPRPAPERLARAAAFIGAAIAELGSPGDRLALALPCPLDDACAPGPCSYGWQGERELVPAILERSGLAHGDVLVMNDAELAAETALGAGRRQGAGERIVVLTVGFGPGGALIS